MSALTIRRSVSVEEISEPETNGGAPLLLYSNYLLIPADEPDVATPADGRPRSAPAAHEGHPLAFSADAASKRRCLYWASGGCCPKKALGKRQRIDPDFSPVQSQLEPPSSTASPVPVQSPMSMPGSSHQPCRSPHATFISGLNPRPAGDFGDPPDTLPGTLP
ncbi:hypothetical protein K438DRAFT_1969688 [Mycena galopus ATCC 62051]|nr:hypothetical protein K438DRAFT_1969688 [Mycena galopus ATCC 62051]